MRRRILAAIAVSVLLSGCVTGLEGVPKSLRADAKVRLKECRAWSDTIAPSRDNSGNISIAGTGLGLRSAVYRTTGAQNEYLIGIRSFIDECNRWARFEIEDRDYRAAKLRLSALAERTLTPESYIAALNELRDELRGADSESIASIDEPRGETEPDPQGGRADDELAKIEGRLAVIEELLRTWPGTIAKENSQTDTGTVGGNDAEGIVTMRYPLFFDVNSSTLRPSELAAARQSLQGALVGCRKRRWLFSGYSDQSGSRLANLELSFARAMAARQAFTSEIGLAGGMTERFGTEHTSNRIAQIEVICVDPVKRSSG
jgi:outer membrane protein OmpA-like peptidoglycan-associated protein